MSCVVSEQTVTPSGPLCDFLRRREGPIVAEWTRRMRSLSPARDLSDAAIIDHLPRILLRIADLVESVHTGVPSSLEKFPKEHAVDRLARGFDLDQIVTEYGLLRRCILDLWEVEMGPVIDLSELRMLDAAFDESLRQSAVKYAQAREKLLRALDRVSEAALGPGDVDAFLGDLLSATLEGTESVHTAVVLLLDGDMLRVRAAHGLEEALTPAFAMKIGESFEGLVATAGQPIFIRNAATDPRVQSEILRSRGVRALYGVPMVRAGTLVGVAHIGSLSAYEFSEEDKLLFRTMVSRATSVLVKAQLAADLTRAEAAQRFLSHVSQQFSESLEYEATLTKIGQLTVPAIADWCVVELPEGDDAPHRLLCHRDPEKEKLADALEPNTPPGVDNVLHTGRAECHAQISDEPPTKLLRELGLQSYLIVPIILHARSIGAIALVLGESGRHYSPSDLPVAEELARRAATAIDNAHLYREAQGAVRLRDRVLAMVSHDLRNQLHVMSTNTALLVRQSHTPADGTELRKTIERLQRTAITMQHLLGDLLDTASIQMGRLAIDRKRQPLEPILEESCDAHEHLARQNGVRLECELAIDGVDVLCDRQRILQVLANLIGNAIKFSAEGHVILVRAEAHDRDIVVAVVDTGPGIPQDEFPSIFEPYFTVPRGGKSGTGLGLFVSRAIIERHGGRIWLESEPGVGTTFFFSLPRT
jgi:signal transduction histidine kinase